MHPVHAGLRPGRHRLRPGRAEGGDRRGQARQNGRGHRTRHMVGGVCINTGTIPSKTLREAVALPDRDEPARAVRRELPGQGGDHPRRPAGPHPARHRQGDRGRPQPADPQPRRAARRAGRFVDPHTLAVEDPTGPTGSPSPGDNIVLATGTQPARPAGRGVRRPAGGRLRRDPRPQAIPASMVVVGAGVIGIEYASMFAALGTKVTVVEKRPQHAGLLRPRDRRGAAVPPARPGGDLPVRRGGDRSSGPQGTVTTLASGKRIPAETVMYSAGRQGRPTTWTSTAPGSRPTTAAGSRSTTTSAPRSPTSTPSAT